MGKFCTSYGAALNKGAKFCAKWEPVFFKAMNLHK
jgi:hypothetical protein